MLDTTSKIQTLKLLYLKFIYWLFPINKLVADNMLDCSNQLLTS